MTHRITLDDFLLLANEEICFNHIMAGLMPDNLDYLDCVIKCSGKDGQCAGYMPLNTISTLEAWQIYNKNFK